MCLGICSPFATIHISRAQKLRCLFELFGTECAAFFESFFSLGWGPCFHRESVNTLHLSFDLQNCEKRKQNWRTSIVFLTISWTAFCRCNSGIPSNLAHTMTASSFAPQLSFSPDISQWMMGPSWDASNERLIESTISEIGEMDMTTTNQSKKCAIQSESDRDCKFLRWAQISHTKYTMKATNTSALKEEMNVLFNAVICSYIKLNDMKVQKAAQLRFVDLDSVHKQLALRSFAATLSGFRESQCCFAGWDQAGLSVMDVRCMIRRVPGFAIHLDDVMLVLLVSHWVTLPPSTWRSAALRYVNRSS